MLTQDEERRFIELQLAMREERPGLYAMLMRGTFRGEHATIVVAVDRRTPMEINCLPLAVMLTVEDRADIRGPDGNALGEMIGPSPLIFENRACSSLWTAGLAYPGEPGGFSSVIWSMRS